MSETAGLPQVKARIEALTEKTVAGGEKALTSGARDNGSVPGGRGIRMGSVVAGLNRPGCGGFQPD